MLLRKFVQTLRPLYDFRACILIGISAALGVAVDPAATAGLAWYLAFVFGMAGAAVIISKIFMPYFKTSQAVTSALNEGNVAAALLVLARSVLLLGVLCVLVIWGK